MDFRIFEDGKEFLERGEVKMQKWCDLAEEKPERDEPRDQDGDPAIPFLGLYPKKTKTLI